MAKQEKGDIKDQLKARGFEESPVLVLESQVEKLYREYRDLDARRPRTPAEHKDIKVAQSKIRFKVDMKCERNRIGNPFKGEVVEQIKPVKRAKDYGKRKTVAQARTVSAAA